MSEAFDPIATNRLRHEIDGVLKRFGISTVDGPPMAYFEVDGERYVYRTYLWGASDESAAAIGYGTTVTPDRFKTSGDAMSAVLDDLAKNHLAAKHPLVWRKEPEVWLERGFYKVYMRFVQVPTQEIADKAAQQARQEAALDPAPEPRALL